MAWRWALPGTFMQMDWLRYPCSFAFVAAAVLLAGCAKPPALSLSELGSLKLAAVEVEGVEVIRSWPAEEQASIASGRGDPQLAQRLVAESAQNFPALQAHFRTVLQQRFSFELSNSVGPILVGTRPVKAVVRLKTFDVPSVAR